MCIVMPKLVAGPDSRCNSDDNVEIERPNPSKRYDRKVGILYDVNSVRNT